MANFEQWINQDLQDPVQAIYSQSLAFSSDNDSILVGVHVTDGGEPATLSGSVVAHVIRSADGGTVSFSGTLSGSDVSAVLPAACFAYPGQIAVMLQLVSGTTKTTLCKALYSVVQGETGTPIDPGSVVPDLDDLLAMLDEMAQATDAAEAAAAAVPAIIAPTFSASAAYAAGSYVYYDGALYRFTTDHAAGAWIGTDAVSVQLAPEVADLKSAIVDAVIDDSYKLSLTAGSLSLGIVNSSTGVYGNSGTRCCTKAFLGAFGRTITINCASGYKASVCAYAGATEDSFIAPGTGLQSGVYVFPLPTTYKFIRVSLAYSDDRQINSGNFADLLANISFTLSDISVFRQEVMDDLHSMQYQRHIGSYMVFDHNDLKSFTPIKKAYDANVYQISNANLLPLSLEFYNNNGDAFNGYNVSSDTVRVRTSSFVIPMGIFGMCVSGYDVTNYTLSGVRAYDVNRNLIPGGAVVFPHEDYSFVVVDSSVAYIHLLFGSASNAVIHPADVAAMPLMLSAGDSPDEYVAPQKTTKGASGKWDVQQLPSIVDLYDKNIVFASRASILFDCDLIDGTGYYSSARAENVKFYRDTSLPNTLNVVPYDAANVIEKYDIDTTATDFWSDLQRLYLAHQNEYISYINSGRKDESGIYVLGYYVLNAEQCGRSNKPQIVLVCNQHGYEKTSAFTAYWLMDALANHYKDNALLDYLHNNVEIVIAPLVNPWGFNAYNSETAGTETGYTNYNNVNINRNYDTVDQSETTFVTEMLNYARTAAYGIDLHANGTTRTSDDYQNTNWLSLHTKGNTDVCDLSKTYLNNMSVMVSDYLSITPTRIGRITGNNNAATLLELYNDLGMTSSTFELPMRLPTENVEFSLACQKVSLILLTTYLGYVARYLIDKQL